MKTTEDRKTETLSAIDKALTQYNKFLSEMDAVGLDFSGAKALSDIAYTLEDCGKFIKECC